LHEIKNNLPRTKFCFVPCEAQRAQNETPEWITKFIMKSKIELLSETRISARKGIDEVAKALFSTLKGEFDNAVKNGSHAEDLTIEKLAKKMTDNAKIVGTADAMHEIELLKPFMPILMSEDELRNIIKTVIDNNPDKANNYKLGNKGALVGMAMKEMKGKADAEVVKSVLEKELGG